MMFGTEKDKKIPRFPLRLLLTGISAGLWLLWLFFGTFPDGTDQPPQGLTPLRQGKILFTLQERLEVARLLNTQRRNESYSQNKRERSNDPPSGILPAQVEVRFTAVKNGGAFHQPAFLKITLHATNPVRAGPSFFS